MAEHPNTNIGMRPTEDQSPSIPRWVKVFALIAILLVILFVALHLTGLAPMGGHGM
jgi:hypothetical protein